ncbi:MAG: type II toxin-antitoxin system VapC family toxin [Solirubrobacterales bacterium]|nr:type II toxin-antitoxin system VapC family toxin [Solirubrobacterales bacterium]
MSFLLDTNVISELRKGDRADRSLTRWLESVPDDEIFISALVIGELRRGVDLVRRRDPAGAASLESWLGRIPAAFPDRILPVDQAAAEEWGRINVPDPVPVIDGLQAATAKVRGFTFVTRNTSDVQQTRVKLLNPFS